MSIELVPLCTVHVTLADPFLIPETPVGMRAIIEVREATLEGERITATLKGAASADWVAVSNAGVATLDVRMLFETGDGALVFVQYGGRSDFSAGPGVKPIYCTPTFETGDERYAWLNAVQAVGKGELDGTSLVYEWAEVR
jgi:hypothetical protein